MYSYIPIDGYDYFPSFSMEPAFEYECFSWGTSLDSIKEETGWSIVPLKDRYASGEGEYLIGMSYYSEDGYSYPREFSHGYKDLYVDYTKMKFTTKSRLYAVEEQFYGKTVSSSGFLEFLHNRYGEFSEENVVTAQQKKKGIKTVFKGPDCFGIEKCPALEILFDMRPIVTVRIFDPFHEYSLFEDSPLDNWICYAALDGQNKRVDFTFLNQNSEGKYLFIGYSKGFEQANISYVRAGVIWGKNADGTYDISGNTAVQSKKYSTQKWNCLFNSEDYIYTYNPGESAREILTLFIESENVKVRHNNSISEFASSGEQLLRKMAEYGISWEELDEALQNEEF